jgi:DNA repair protein SbcD/Mre11
MRFLHTGDWHVGKPLRGRSRMEEYTAALDEVHRVAVEAKVDAVLIAGDVFDSAAPPPEAERLVYDFLARLIPNRIACALIAGNHDHPKRLGALARLVEGLRIFVRSEVRAPSDGGLVELHSRDGNETALVAVLPFVPERKVVDACQLLGPEHTWFEAYARRLEQILGFLAAGFTPRTVNVVLAHVLISGGRVGTGERPLHLGEAYGVNAQQLPASAQYVALGHLHRPQEIQAPSRAFYSGSLIELDFGEREQDKRVVVIEAMPGRAASIESIPITAGRRLREVEGTLHELKTLAPELGRAYLRVRVKVDGPVPGIAEQVREVLPEAVDVVPVYEHAPQTTCVASLRHLRPSDLFTGFYRAKNGVDPTPEMMELFHRAYEEAAGA